MGQHKNNVRMHCLLDDDNNFKFEWDLLQKESITMNLSLKNNETGNFPFCMLSRLRDFRLFVPK